MSREDGPSPRAAFFFVALSLYFVSFPPHYENPYPVPVGKWCRVIADHGQLPFWLPFFGGGRRHSASEVSGIDSGSPRAVSSSLVSCALGGHGEEKRREGVALTRRRDSCGGNEQSSNHHSSFSDNTGQPEEKARSREREAHGNVRRNGDTRKSADADTDGSSNDGIVLLESDRGHDGKFKRHQSSCLPIDREEQTTYHTHGDGVNASHSYGKMEKEGRRMWHSDLGLAVGICMLFVGCYCQHMVFFVT